MRIIYGCIFFSLVMVCSALGQEKCKSKIEHTVLGNASDGYSIALQSAENFSNLEVELYDLYQGKTIEKKQVRTGLRSRQIIFSRVKPSLYLIYVKHDKCPRAQSLGGVTGIKVGNIE